MFPNRFLLRVCAGLVLAGISLAADAADTLVPPPGYYAAVGHKGSSFSCPDMPAPFTDKLEFRSKYEGSGKARDTVNEEAEADYKEKTKPVNDMEKGVNKIVEKYMESGKPEILKCAIDWYSAWADAQALEAEADNHTGRSIRKWSLASLSGAWLHLEFSSSQPLAAYPEQTKKIESWLSTIADKVVSEWSESDPIDKINNHYYWAAWSVMATSVVLNRKDLFDWSTKMYRIFAGQVDADGYLPNEMKRESRALNYHNYALMPLAMMAAFGKANGVDLAGADNSALSRVVNHTLDGVADPKLFENKSGFKQNLEGFDDPSSKFAWLEPYCWTVSCSGAAAQKLGSLRPLKNTRLGGDMTSVFGGRQ